MSNYSPEILQYLIRGGWFKNRTVNIDSVKSYALSEGFAWFTQVEEFLKEFSGLCFTCIANDGTTTDFKFDVLLSIESFDTFWILKYYANKIDKQTSFCPIGVLGGSHMQLFMDEEGCFYGGYDDILISFGSNPKEFLQNLCLGTGGQSLHNDEPM